MTIALRFGNRSLRDALRRISSRKSNDVTPGLLTAAPPDRQLLQFQLISFGARTSRQPAPSLEAKRGTMMSVLSMPSARNAAAGGERRELWAARPAPRSL